MKQSCTLALAICALAVSANADHSEIIAAGRPEHRLAGINVYRSRLPGTVKHLGKPHSMTEEPVEGYPGSVSRDYVWRSQSCVLTAACYSVKGQESPLYFVSVSGCSQTPKEWRSGAGLKLGMTISEVKQLYGTRFSGDAGPGGTVDYEFRDGTTLSLELDSSQRVSTMKLTAEVE